MSAVLRAIAGWSLAWLFAAALYLLLIDITDLPELIVGAGAAAVAATAFELAREQHLVVETVRARWLLRVLRPVMKVPFDIWTLLIVALAQLARPAKTRGEFRVVPFRGEDEDGLETGRRALAEGAGSFSPNTIIVGVDGERELLLAHQLRRTEGTEAIDVLKLG